MATSAKQRINCFIEALPVFLKDQAKYLADRKVGIRPAKNKK